MPAGCSCKPFCAWSEITHAWTGDLQLELIAPSGQATILHNRIGGSQDDLITIYDSELMPALAVLVGQPIHGDWILRVSDLSTLDVGILNGWSLELTKGE